MAVITPPSVSMLPTPPSTASPTSFDSAADAFLGALPDYQTEQNALAANVYANAVDAAASATAANTSKDNASTSEINSAANAVAAAASAGASLWVSGATYAIGNARYSPVNQRVYRRITAGAGATDPSADGTNWKAVDVDPVAVVVAGTSQTAVASTHYVLTNIAATTVTLPAGAEGATVAVTATGALTTNVIARNGSNTIMGLAENMVLDKAGVTVTLRYLSNSWRLI